jgi:hypothetical protein
MSKKIPGETIREQQDRLSQEWIEFLGGKIFTKLHQGLLVGAKVSVVGLDDESDANWPMLLMETLAKHPNETWKQLPPSALFKVLYRAKVTDAFQPIEEWQMPFMGMAIVDSVEIMLIRFLGMAAASQFKRESGEWLLRVGEFDLVKFRVIPQENFTIAMTLLYRVNCWLARAIRLRDRKVKV